MRSSRYTIVMIIVCGQLPNQHIQRGLSTAALCAPVAQPLMRVPLRLQKNLQLTLSRQPVYCMMNALHIETEVRTGGPL